MVTDGTERRSPQRILVIDDDAVVCLSCARVLGADGHSVETEQSPRSGLQKALTGEYDLILLDLVMPELRGLDVLRQLREAGLPAEVIIITGYSTVETAVEAMKMGAADYVSKPFNPSELRMAVDKVVERSALLRENAALRRIIEEGQSFEGLIGESRAMEQVYQVIRRVAPTHSTVLITGESGTGKELVARAIHRLSPCADRPFLACDCSSLVPTLLESELFGHVKGSFTGAVAAKQGLFRAASGGTLFLDEISNVSLEIQGKLLRALESRRVKPVGATEEIEVDIRLISASNRDLRAMCDEGTFREDLFYRLNVVPIHMPPLRERTGDIPILLHHFLERTRRKNALTARAFSPEALRILERHSWPGNVRELKNMVERMAILCDGDRIDIPHVPPEVRPAALPGQELPMPRDWEEFKRLKREVRESATDELERRFLAEALRRAEGNVSRAAEKVGMQRTNFHALMRRHGLTADGE
jgi:two-component system response regulator PilR (NtrC family)